MKIVHTSDWHVGKVLKGRDRHDKHVAVLRSIVQGDLFETAAPKSEGAGPGHSGTAGIAGRRSPGRRYRREP